ncbi:hypothetical protein Glove_84g140 [Diversispora epigaea]|uniref:Uncharacterized protein n=1 Tax=Diversispora epigaea TaxID=1348612 RepID=A0A397J7D7_9GLOM|nr:hypothetical protein Glove_84g140 [Diversispora epigaea]
MPKSHITPGKLVATGSIESKLHYGPYLRDWWIFSKEKTQENQLYYPIPLRLGLEVIIQLNNNPFIVRVVCNVHSPLQPGYICEGKGKSSGINTSATAAITSVYQLVFGSKTKCAGLSYLGLDQPETAQKLLEGVIFRPFIIELENITVFVGCLGKITKNTNQSSHNYHNYSSSLFYKYKKTQSVFHQHIDKDLFLIKIYQNSQIVAEYKDISSNAVWNKTGILTSISGDTLFAINHPITLDIINQAHQEIYQLPKCTLANWNNEMIMEKLYELHLKRNIRRSIEWRQIFQSWKQQKSNIIELYTHLNNIYDLDYKFPERELRAWYTILHATGCTNITPYNKDVSHYEFWTNASDPEKDRETIIKLYTDGLLNITSPTRIFWNCFRNSYNVNPKGINGKTRILSIIGESFMYKELVEELKISPNTVNAARKYSRINGPGCPALKKPVIVHSKMPEIKEKEFQLFFADKANVNMSSYKIDAKTQLPVLYLKDQKSALWKKFSTIYSDGMKRTSFMSRLQNSRFKYREDLGGLCITCNDYGYQPFENLIELVTKNFSTSCFESVFMTINPKPLWIKIISDNGGHYHNSELMTIISHWYDWYNVEVRGWIFLEPGEAKTTVDSHHATIAHAIKRYIRIGCDLTEGENIETALQDLSGTSVSHIEPNRDMETLDQTNSRNNQKSKTIHGISKWFEWNWPVTGQFAGYIRARSLPHIGKWIDFSPAQISVTNRPSPIVSEPTKSNTPWTIPDPKKKDLELSMNDVMSETNKRENEIGLVNNKLVSNSELDAIRNNKFPLKKGWALKENLKLGNKGGGKRITKKVVQYLQGFFLAGNLRAADRYSPENMHASLKELAAEGELTLEDIPTVKTIKGWIGRYSASFKKEASERALVESNKENISIEGNSDSRKRQKTD